jgi:prepilin-type N-terminal cleavage/methylation domain-containing protein
MHGKQLNHTQCVSFSLTSNKRHGMGSALVNMGARAFTLIELLIVVAIIAILAAIAVPNFIEAQTRAKVSRVIADMRSMQTAIEMYRVDTNKPPIRNDHWNDTSAKRYIPDGTTKIFDPDNPDASVGLRGITTPISYISSIPIDIFNTPMQALVNQGVEGASMGLDYWDPAQFKAFRLSINAGRRISEQGYALLSVGPDRYLGGLNAARPGYPTDQPGPMQNTIRWIYDASNGTTSYGNVYRFSDGLSQSDIYPVK